MDLFRQVLIESETKQVRGPTGSRATASRPRPQGVRFDRSFLAIAAAVEGMGVALESTRLAERELASGPLVRPLAGLAEDVRYVGYHWCSRVHAPASQFAAVHDVAGHQLGLQIEATF